MQALFRDHVSSIDPFVGLIISPFDLRLPTLLSSIVWYNVACPQSQPTPMAVEVTLDFQLPKAPTAVQDPGLASGCAPDASAEGLPAVPVSAPVVEGEGAPVQAPAAGEAAPSCSDQDETASVVEGLVSCVHGRPAISHSLYSLQKYVVGQCVANVQPVDPNDVWRELGSATTNFQKLKGSIGLRCVCM